MLESELRDRIRGYEFYHVIRLTENVETPGVRRWIPYQNVTLSALRRIDCQGKRVLDIGCRDGLFAFEAEKLSAEEIIGLDNNLSRPATEFLIPYFKSKVRMVELNVLDLSRDHFGLFDVVIFSGVLYHLRQPFAALKNVRDVLKPGGMLLVETILMLDNNRFAMLHCPVQEHASQDKTSCTFFNLKGLQDTLGSFGVIVERVEWLTSRRRRRLARLRSGLPSLGDRPRNKATDRATLTCRYSPGTVDPELDSYWHRTHQTHSWK